MEPAIIAVESGGLAAGFGQRLGLSPFTEVRCGRSRSEWRWGSFKPGPVPKTATVTIEQAGAGGKIVMTSKTAISADGKTLTATSDGTDPLGRAVHNVALYDRK